MNLIFHIIINLTQATSKFSFSFLLLFFNSQFINSNIFVAYLQNQDQLKQIMMNRALRKQMEKTQIKFDSKCRMKFRPHHRRTNVEALNTLQTATNKKKYLIELINVADQSKSLQQVFKLFYPSIFQEKKGNQQAIDKQKDPGKQKLRQMRDKYQNLNKLFKFAIEMYEVQYKIVRKSFRATQLERFNLTQLFDQSQNPTKESLILEIQAMQKRAITQIYQDLEYKIKQYCRQKTIDLNQIDISILFQIYKLRRNYYITQIMNMDQKDRLDLYFPQNYFNYNQNQATLDQHILKKNLKNQVLFLNDVTAKLFQVQFTKRQAKKLKYQNFVRKDYGDYLQTNYSAIKNQKDRPYKIRANELGSIIIKRYTPNNRDEILINIKNLMNMRKDKIVADEHFLISKGLIQQLIKHNDQTANNYPLLSPQAVIFNQLSLKVQLNYQNILQQATGLLFKPLTIQNKILFNLTPSTIDYFQSPYQHKQVEQLKLYHFLFGYDRFFYANNSQEQKLIIQKNKSSPQKQQLMKKSQLFRSIMTISYIMNGEKFINQQIQTYIHNQFAFAEPSQSLQVLLPSTERKNIKGGDTTQIDDGDGPIGSKKNWQKCIKSVANYLIKYKQKYTILFGHKFMNSLSLQKQEPKYEIEKGLYFLKQLISDQKNDYSIVKDYQFANIYNRIGMIQTVMKQFFSILQINEYFGTIFNAVKYLTRLYFALYIDLTFLKMIATYFNQDDLGKGVSLMKTLKRRLNLAKEQDRKILYMEQSMHKFKQYAQRHHKRPEPQILFLLKKYKKQFQQKDQYYRIYNQLIYSFLQFNEELEGKQSARQKIKFYKQKIKEPCGKIQQQLTIIQTYSKKFIQQEYLVCLQTRTAKYKSQIEKIKETKDYKNQNPRQIVRLNKKILEYEQIPFKNKYVSLKIQIMIEILLSSNTNNLQTIQSVFIPLLDADPKQLKDTDPKGRSKFLNNRNELMEYSIQSLKQICNPSS